MLSLKAPSALEDANEARAPLDLVCCIDKSGSMRGEKMKLMKATLELLVTRTGLCPTDRLALVAFDSNVSVDMPLTSMDGDGRSRAEQVVKALRPGSTTNLSGGALKAIDLLGAGSVDARRAASGQAATRAVLLFTDGHATDGIRETPRLVSAVQGALEQAAAAGGPISLMNFGFGADHSEELLRSLAESGGAGGGQYYYVSNADDIPTAFADCLGGLVSIVAQNATIGLSALGGARVTRVLGSTYRRATDGSIEIGDLYSDDKKDLLLELSLPTLPKPAGPAPVLRATLRAFDVARMTVHEAAATLEISRPEATPSDQPVNTALDEQRNRLLVAEAMENAARLADRGDLEGGRGLLSAVRSRVQQSASAMTPLSAALVGECETLQSTYSDDVQYRSVGSKMSKMHARSHAIQRTVHTNAGVYGGAAARKSAMKAKWLSSLGGSSDSD